ncbi:hypothetical protein ABK040_006097 [Willaertia magna]
MSDSKSSASFIPINRSATIKVEDRDILLSDISQTPGGTLYGTTPGGTRRVYSRNALLYYRHSPMAKSPPMNLPSIPGITTEQDQSSVYEKRKEEEEDEELVDKDDDEEEDDTQFQME